MHGGARLGRQPTDTALHDTARHGTMQWIHIIGFSPPRERGCFYAAHISDSTEYYNINFFWRFHHPWTLRAPPSSHLQRSQSHSSKMAAPPRPTQSPTSNLISENGCSSLLLGTHFESLLEIPPLGTCSWSHHGEETLSIIRS